MRPFQYEAAGADAAAAMRAAAAGASFLAGGTNLLDLMKIGVAQPSVLMDLAGLAPAHGGIEAGPAGLRLGGLATMAAAETHPAVLQGCPAAAQSLRAAASPQLRNMATLGGNVLQRTRCGYFRDARWAACNKRRPGSGCGAIGGVTRQLAVLGVSASCIAHYPGDFATVLAAFEAEVEILQPGGGVRRMPFEALHRLPGHTPHVETVLAPGELIVAFTLPAAAWARRSLYLKIRDRDAYDFALASAAVGLEEAEGVVRAVRIGLGGVAAKPWRSHAAEAALQGRALTEAAAQEAAEAAFAGAVTHGENAFKPDLGRRTLVRALLAAQKLEG